MKEQLNRIEKKLDRLLLLMDQQAQQPLTDIEPTIGTVAWCTWLISQGRIDEFKAYQRN